MNHRTTELVLCLVVILLIAVLHVLAGRDYFTPSPFHGPINSVYSSFPDSNTWTTDYGIPFGDACLGYDEHTSKCKKGQKFECTLNPHNKYVCSWK
jgi:hypothetical protein